MSKKIEIPKILGTGIVMLVLSIHFVVGTAEKKSYIIQKDKDRKPAGFINHNDWYDSVSKSSDRIYTYTHVFDGFSASLTAEEAENLETQPGVMSVFPDVVYKLHTTRTPWFLGLQNPTKHFPTHKRVGEVVIGLLDTGIWPECRSFNDEGFDPPKRKWECESGTNFSSCSCNNKLIGARFFARGYEKAHGHIKDGSGEFRSPRDSIGHGTHTASIAAGSPVRHANYFGLALGTAQGMVPEARVAMYKVCWFNKCYQSDILAGMDSAIKDSVSVLSISLMSSKAIVVGAFAAMEKGISVVCSAGNDGPNSSTVENDAPWVTTVGAGTIDRDFRAYIRLGNGKTYVGKSLSKCPSSHLRPRSFVFAGNVSYNGSSLCANGTLIPEKVKGKIVLCDRGVSFTLDKGWVVREAGGAGMVLANTKVQREGLHSDQHYLPAVHVGEKTGDEMRSYLSSSSNPTATIPCTTTKTGVQPAPMVAAFSSRGPNRVILKPDLIAPGDNILAGWSGVGGPTMEPEDTRRVEFNIFSGTSMSCSHVSGLTALLKAAHPEWSPAAIRSALMTTAYTTDRKGRPLLDESTHEPSTPFDHGAGHVDPVQALDPGLVYNLTTIDYLKFLCALNYKASEIKKIAKETSINCEEESYTVTHLNYPSFALEVPPKKGCKNTTRVFFRTLTNVGDPGTYIVSISFQRNKAFTISVFPSVLDFTEETKENSYAVTVTANSMPPGTNQFATIVWTDGKHWVRSPVAISWINATE